MIAWITSLGWTVDFTTENTPRGHKFIEFRHKRNATFWRLTIREAFEYLGGPTTSIQITGGKV